MKIIRLAAISVVAAVLFASCGTSDDSEQVAELEDRLAGLEEENAELRAQLEDTEAQAPATETSELAADEAESASSTTADQSEPSQPAGAGDVDLAVEFGFTPNPERQIVSAGAIVTNNGGLTACGVDVQFTLLDSAGTPVETVTESVPIIRANEAASVAPVQIGYQVADPAELTVTVVNVENTTDGASLDDCNGFYIYDGIDVEVVNPALVPGEFDTSISGQLSNSSDVLVELTSINCVILAGGQVVGGESTSSSDPITPGGTVAFSMSFISFEGSADEVRCTAIA